MSEGKSKFSKCRLILQILLVVLSFSMVTIIVFWGQIESKYIFYRDWMHERKIQERMGEKPYSWQEYEEYLEWKREKSDPEFVKNSFKDDAKKSLGGKTPEELLSFLNQALKSNDIERSLLFVHKLWRESYNEKWENYIKINELSEMVKDFSLDKMICNLEDVKDCKDNYCLFFQQTLSCSVPSENIDILLVKNYADKWQLLEGLGL